ncbi:PepSY domain-containing protein [Gloeobacter kilaueensis]|uniref:PepSY domain-containing protein n=1 Tax=Gloeobacter kilaueensis (strain ATCC BAA-2537 / CCAP 1431/1 / ULC 316 / JS1) TaxID=1183438 RepID=U5QEV6_GLOK1|nr:PepSY domain-containing protein [Gloeobacter kilaueensis]AGY57383.1 hypothetical protein GKIL_1137 [Gloeobacter kilaueensis JS1]
MKKLSALLPLLLVVLPVTALALPPGDPDDAIRAGLKSEVPLAPNLQDAHLTSPAQVQQMIARQTRAPITRLELEIKNGYLFYEVEAGGKEFWIDPGSNRILQTLKARR